MKKTKQSNILHILDRCQSEDGLATREFLNRIADKWSILIVIVLSEQPDRRARFSDLKNGIDGISQTMLTSTLRTLERDGMITREAFPEIPPRVEYQLTKFGLSVLEPMRSLAEWVSQNWGAVKRARASFDSRQQQK